MAGLIFPTIFGLLAAAIAGALMWTLPFKLDKHLRVITAVCAFAGAFAGIQWVDRKIQRDVDARHEQKQQWLANMQAADCKRTSYVSTKYSVYPIWTCPDGQAHIERF